MTTSHRVSGDSIRPVDHTIEAMESDIGLLRNSPDSIEKPIVVQKIFTGFLTNGFWTELFRKRFSRYPSNLHSRYCRNCYDLPTEKHPIT